MHGFRGAELGCDDTLDTDNLLGPHWLPDSKDPWLMTAAATSHASLQMPPGVSGPFVSIHTVSSCPHPLAVGKIAAARLPCFPLWLSLRTAALERIA